MRYIVILAFLIASALICSTVITSSQQPQAKKYIAFRDDDVRPFTPLNTLKAVNQVQIDENVPVTLGVIPHPRESQEGNQLLQDDQFLIYMRSIASNPLFEFAQHGYTHTRDRLSPSPSEFNGRSYDEQYNRIFKGRADLAEAFGMVPKTFIPPWNECDLNTTKAAEELGFTELNTVSTSYFNHRYENGMRIDGSIDIGAANETAFNASIHSAQNITERFLNEPQSDDMLIVTYHAWAFQDDKGAVDNHRIQQLTNFIDFLKTKDVLFTRLDRADVFGGAVSPVSSTGLALTHEQRNPSVPLLVGSVSVILFGIYVSARRQDEKRNEPKD